MYVKEFYRVKTRDYTVYWSSFIHQWRLRCFCTNADIWWHREGLMASGGMRPRAMGPRPRYERSSFLPFSRKCFTKLPASSSLSQNPQLVSTLCIPLVALFFYNPARSFLSGTKKTLGRITLGHRHFFSAWANSADLTKGIDHWHDMAHRPGVSIERWHPFI